MWFFTTEGFYSAVLETRGANKGKLVVRAREPGAIDLLRERYMPGLSEQSIAPASVKADYRYRGWVTHEAFAEGLAAIAKAIDYSNFKSEVARKRGLGGFEKSTHDVWTVMSRLQPGGPYNVGGKQYPAIPADERPKGKGKRRKKGEPELPSLVLENDVCETCEDCGHPLDQETGEWFQGRWVCRSVVDCSDRRHARSR